MAEKAITVDLDAANPIAPPEVEQIKATTKDVVFVPNKDVTLTINQTVLHLTARAPVKVTRDQARILTDADAGMIMM